MDGLFKIVILILAMLVAVFVAAIASPFIILWPNRQPALSWKQAIDIRYRRIYALGRMIVFICDHSFLGPMLPWDYRK